MGVESVSVEEALSHADTLEISCHFPTRVLLPGLESMESKRHTSYRSYSTNVYIQNQGSTALKLLGKTVKTQIVLSPVTSWTLYNYIYLEDNTAYCAKYWWHNGEQNKNQKTPKTWNAVSYSVSNKQKPSTIPSRKCNNCIWAPLYNSLSKYLISKVLRLKISNFISTNFWRSLLMSQKCPTMSPHQEATASSTSSLIWGLKEFTEVVESPTRPWSNVRWFETTPSIQLHRLSLLIDMRTGG